MTSTVHQKIHDVNLDKKLETLLLKLLEYNSEANVEVPIRHFLSNYEIISDNFWEQFKQTNTYEGALESYYKFSKDQCMLVDSLLQTLQFTLNKDNTKEELSTMLKDAFTF
ncbi:MAG: hypothetical protein GWN01_02950 [Nitrosopumilaceae archaeon]|nr:hypothetical protein [Nitrosopumilaceae archaeon]NIT99923.1 hypothetical protein [Nitrosopumilaceae archaeon]NIU86276.1 hypothetical protein [Nitrosopumilaceae archaeon]NIV65031.1 hypothetical protein [Nitrosopumilaceae archaeon]NIX60526.1 hypothetical protein [Nitrosopumilaceae archaeon]